VSAYETNRKKKGGEKNFKIREKKTQMVGKEKENKKRGFH